MNKQEIASAIANARRTGEQCDLPWPDERPSVDAAMEVQEAVFEAFGENNAGWKVGATNEGARKAFNIDIPFYGPMAVSGVLENGASMAKTSTVMAVEPEYAFRMARDFPANGEAVNTETATDAVEACHIALEVIGRCVKSAGFQNGIGLTMDFAGNVAFVVGDEIANWAEQDLVNTKVLGQADGETINEGNGVPVMGDPINSLVWMAQTLADRGLSLKKGDWVSTGTCTVPVPAEAGKTISGTFGDFGTVSVKFT